jgi:hypothetical protein
MPRSLFNPRPHFRLVCLLLSLVSGGSFFHPFSVYGYEVDSFTRRDRVPDLDSLPLLDERVQGALREATKRMNLELQQKALKCIPGDALLQGRLEDILAELLVGSSPVTTRFEKEFMALPEGRYAISTRPVDSIYNHPKYQMIVISGMIVPELLVGGIRTGTDKLGHFVQLGYRLHKRSRLSSRSRRPLKRCEDLARVTSESGYYGCGSGGFVFSYADMIANVAGLRFWQKVVSLPAESYISCAEDGLYRVQEPSALHFTFADYVSPLWDEAVNCSMDCPIGRGFESSQAVTVTSRVKRYSCPWPKAEFEWQGQKMSATQFCSDFARSFRENRSPFPVGFEGATDCVQEVVSPACLAIQ